MATIKKTIVFTTIPKAIQRGNAYPLDASSVWYSYDEMAKYAASNPTAYVGQIVSLVDEKGDATAYIIKNIEGELIQVGTGVASGTEAIFGDNRSVVINEETVSLKNWGVKYYKWDEEASTHVLVEVDDANPWIEGLEPRVDMVAGVPELAWYQPSTLTVEGLNSTVATLQNTVGDISALIGSATDTAESGTLFGNINAAQTQAEQNTDKIEELDAGKLGIEGGILTGPLVLEDGSAAVSEQEVDTKIAAAVGSAGTLKREIVEVLPDPANADVNTIYMVLNDVGSGDDKYNEYMVINGAFELIGTTGADLTGYIPVIEEFETGDLASITENGILISAGIRAEAIKNHIANNTIHVTQEERNDWSATKALAEESAQKIAAIPVLSEYEINKLATLPPIATIGAGLALDENGTLSATGEGGSGYVLPTATENVLGGVKSSSENNHVSVDANGAMTVNMISTSKLYVPEGEELVLYGGTSKY